jgi:hypothetical protein
MIVGLQRDAQVQLQDAVGSQQQPITSSRQNLPAKPRPFEIASRDRHEGTNAIGYRTELLHRSGDDTDRHEGPRCYLGGSPGLVFERAHG